MTRPKIGIVLDFKSGSTTGYSIRPHYAIRANYIEMINKQNALAILIPYDYNSINDYISMLDGLLMIGGFFDISPKKYGQNTIHKSIVLNETREKFEWEFMTKALATQMPVLGICNGMQLLNVIRGGDLIQHIPDEKGDFLNHEQSKVVGKEDSSKAYHDVLIEENSILRKIVDAKEISTNSSHHQAVKNVGKGLKISARASDGIIEGIEDQSRPFCVGVQWHPEFNVSLADEKIFESFVSATRDFKSSK